MQNGFKKAVIRHPYILLWVFAGILLIAFGALLGAQQSRDIPANANRPEVTDERVEEITHGTEANIAAATTTVTTTTTLCYETIPVSNFRAEDLSANIATDMDYTTWWYDSQTDSRYLFFPATADLSSVKLTFEAAGGLALNGIRLTSGECTDVFADETEFQITTGELDCGTLHVMQSDLPCIFLETETGSIAQVEKRNGNKDTGKLLILDENGGTQYDGALEWIQAHGNSSWDYSKKKPYNIKLENKADLFGMGKAKKWALLSNYLDHGMIRNSTALKLSELAGCEYTMDSVYTDLYIHGEYRGTYQLYERVQVQKNRVNITDLEEANEEANEQALDAYQQVISNGDKSSYAPDTYKYWNIPNNPSDITGGYLLQFQTYNRYPSKAASGFVTKRGQCVQLQTPEHASKDELFYIRTFMQELEDAIYSENGYNSKGKHYSDYLDVESFLKSYLIQEITENADGSYTSFFFWKESDTLGDGKLHCGPVWDFDLGFCNFARLVDLSSAGIGKFYSAKLDAFYAKHLPINGFPDNDASYSKELKAKHPEMAVGWMGMLYEKEIPRITELYFETFLPAVEQICDTEIPALTAYLSKSAAMNNAKWNMLGKNRPLGPVNGYTYEECTAYISNYLTKHCDFLTKEWLSTVKESLADNLPNEMNQLPLNAYDSKGIAALCGEIAAGQAEIQAAGDYTATKEAYQAAIASFADVPTAEISGDFDDNGEVDSLDATALLRHYAKSLAEMDDPVTATQRQNGDVDKNGKLDAVDAMHILRHSVNKLMGVDYPLPVEK